MKQEISAREHMVGSWARKLPYPHGTHRVLGPRARTCRQADWIVNGIQIHWEEL